MAELEDKKVEDIEVIEPKIIKPKKVKRVVKYTFKEDVGTRNGAIRYEKGKDYELTKKQIDNYKLNNLIWQQ